jgi:hypothetical protein
VTEGTERDRLVAQRAGDSPNIAEYQRNRCGRCFGAARRFTLS